MTESQKQRRGDIAMVKHLIGGVRNYLDMLNSVAKLAVNENADLREQVARLKKKLSGKDAHTPCELKRRIYLLGKLAAEYLDMNGWTERTITLDDGRDFTIKIDAGEATTPASAWTDETN